MRQTRIASNDFRPVLVVGSPEGSSWSEPHEIFPSEAERYSIFGQIGRGSQPGELLFYGSRCERLHQDESFWNDALQAMLPTDLIWSRSMDEGRTWEAPRVIPCTLPCAMEVTSPICVSRTGRWLACFSPHRSTAHPGAVDPCLNQIVLVMSDDAGATWDFSPLCQFPANVGGAEAWVIELSDGRLLGTGCQVDRTSDGGALPDVYAISEDNGGTWTPPREALAAQTSATLARADGSVFFIYADRLREPFGIGIAHARPGPESFGISKNERIWVAETHNEKAGVSGEFRNWTTYVFGEPSLLELRDGIVIAMFWKHDDNGGSIPFVRLNL